MRKLFYSTALAFMSFVPAAHAQAAVFVPAVPFALVVPMPEPSSPALLAVDLLAVGAAVFVLSRRKSGAKRQ